MRGTNRRSRYNLPLSIVPQPGKVGQDFREAAGAESSHILQEDVLRSSFANKTGCVGPEPAVVFVPFPAPRERGGLAGESGADEGGPNASVEVERTNVIMGRSIRPVFSEDGPAVRVDLTKERVLESSGSLESKADTSDPLEQANVG